MTRSIRRWARLAALGTAATALTQVAFTTPANALNCNVLNTSGVCIDITTGNFVVNRTFNSVAIGSGPTHDAVGTVDVYRFPLAIGGSALLPCVVLTVDSVHSNTCAEAGGTYDRTLAVLVDESVTEPAVVTGPPLLTVRVCEALYTVTVVGAGVEQIPAVATC